MTYGAAAPYGYCPVCGMEGTTRCRCVVADTQCPCGHHWHFRGHEMHLGPWDHSRHDDHEGCVVVPMPSVADPRFTRGPYRIAPGRLKLPEPFMAHQGETNAHHRAGETEQPSANAPGLSEKPRWGWIAFTTVATLGLFFGTLHLRRLT